MPQPLWACDGIHFIRLGDDIILLDVAADTYSCLADAGPVVRLEDTGRIMVDDADLAIELKAYGLVQTDRPLRAPQTPVLASREVPQSPVRTDTTTVALTLVHLLVSTVAFRRKTLGQLLDAVETGPRASARKTDLARILAAYHAALPWTPFEGECLQRGFLLKRLLRSHGIASDWIFGVRTWPFAAHCWIQVDDLVVGDSLERIGVYTPIMVA